MKSNLEAQLCVERIAEMERYERTTIYPAMRGLLCDGRAKILDLLNHGLAMVDDEFDSREDSLVLLRYFQQLFQQSYSGVQVSASTPAEQAVLDLGFALRENASPYHHFADRAVGKHTYHAVNAFWVAEEKNLQRKGSVLDKKSLDEVTLEVGASVATQFLGILDYPRVFGEFVQLARAYGFAVKLADNLCDFKDDVQKGFVNVPLEDMHYVEGVRVQDDRVIATSPDEIVLNREYVEGEYRRIVRLFESADRLMLIARARRPFWDRKTDDKLILFKQFCHSWLTQANDYMETAMVIS